MEEKTCSGSSLITFQNSSSYTPRFWTDSERRRGSDREAFGWQDKERERPMDTLSGSYSSLHLGSPLSYLFNSTLCYVVSGVSILVVGVIITSVTFQNLDPLHEGNKERYAGPVLMGAGILVMGRGAIWKLKQLDCRATIGRHRALWRRLCSWHQQHDEDSESAAICLEPTDPEELLYCDDPPSYAQVTSQSSESATGGSATSSGESAGSGAASTSTTTTTTATTSITTVTVQADHFGAISNPALVTDDEEGLAEEARRTGLESQASVDSYPGFPPPPYEEVRHIHQTRI